MSKPTMNLWVKGKRKRVPLLAGTTSLLGKILGIEPKNIKIKGHQLLRKESKMWCSRCQKIVNTEGEEKQDLSNPGVIFTLYHCPNCNTFLAMARVDRRGNVKAIGLPK